MTEWKWRLIVTGAVILACSVSYLVGKKQQSMDDSLRVNQDSIHVRDSVTRVDSSKVDSAKKTADILTAYRSKVRTKIKVVHDTVYAVGDSTDGPPDLEQVITDNPVIAQLITASDSALKAQANLIALQDTLIAGLRKGIQLRDERVALLESRRLPRLTSGVQIGVGYCQTPDGQTPCAYVGYGFSVRLR